MSYQNATLCHAYMAALSVWFKSVDKLKVENKTGGKTYSVWPSATNHLCGTLVFVYSVQSIFSNVADLTTSILSRLNNPIKDNTPEVAIAFWKIYIWLW